MHSQKVILRIPETSMTDDQCKMVGTIGVASAIFDGVVFHGYNEKALSGFDDISPISGDKQCGVKNGEKSVCMFWAKSGISTVYAKPCMMNIPDSIVEKYSLIELFAGGFAGWSQAACVLQTLGVAWESTVAVELDKCIAQMYADNSRCEIIDADDVNFCLDESLTADRKGSVIFRGSVCDRRFTRLVPWMQRQVVTIPVHARLGRRYQ